MRSRNEKSYDFRKFMGKLPENSYAVTDPRLVAELEQQAHLNYFNSREGYVVEFCSDTGGLTILYVPAEKLPKAMAEGVQAAF